MTNNKLSDISTMTKSSPKNATKKWKKFIECAVTGCNSGSKDHPNAKKYFRFPAGTPRQIKRYFKWVEFAQCGTPAFHRFICDKHFELHHFINSSKVGLNMDAVPTVGGPAKCSPVHQDVIDPELLRTISVSSTELVLAESHTKSGQSCISCPSTSAMKDDAKIVVHHSSETLANNCTLSFDSMSVREYLECDPHPDVLTGFGDDQRKALMSDHLLVFTAKGSFVHWKQPICFFLSPKPVEGVQLKEIIKQVVRACKDAGLRILAAPT